MFKDFYIKKFHEARKLEDKKTYAEAAGIEFDVGAYIRETYLGGE